jgi:hypothetical protein
MNSNKRYVFQGVRVQGFGFGAQGLGFWVSGSGFGVSGGLGLFADMPMPGRMAQRCDEELLIFEECCGFTRENGRIVLVELA